MGTKGDAGATGTTGATGAGTRTVYTGICTGPVTTISCPAITLSDFPLVGAYARMGGNDWVAMNLNLGEAGGDPNNTDVIAFANITEGEVTFFGCDTGMDLKVVVVK